MRRNLLAAACAALATCLVLAGWRAWTDYSDFRVMREQHQLMWQFVAPIMQQQAQQQRQQAEKPAAPEKK